MKRDNYKGECIDLFGISGRDYQFLVWPVARKLAGLKRARPGPKEANQKIIVMPIRGTRFVARIAGDTNSNVVLPQGFFEFFSSRVGIIRYTRNRCHEFKSRPECHDLIVETNTARRASCVHETQESVVHSNEPLPTLLRYREAAHELGVCATPNLQPRRPEPVGKGENWARRPLGLRGPACLHWQRSAPRRPNLLPETRGAAFWAAPFLFVRQDQNLPPLARGRKCAKHVCDYRRRQPRPSPLRAVPQT